MSIAKTWQTDSTNLENTEKIAEKVGRKLKGGEIVELVSDLGGGKTAFVRGLARGAGSQDHVASPTFTISREYRAGELTLHHFDFYRLSEPGLMTAELAELMNDPKTVVAVEWSGIVQHILPKERIVVAITLKGDTSRHISITYPEKLEYLIPKES